MNKQQLSEALLINTQHINELYEQNLYILGQMKEIWTRMVSMKQDIEVLKQRTISVEPSDN
jgi:hypothetical protein